MRFDRMKRREFICILGIATTWPLVSFGQAPARMRRVGVVMAYAEDDANGQTQIDAFRKHLRMLGWTEGDNISIDVRYARDDAARIRELAADLLRKMPDLIGSNSNLVTTVLQTEVRTIPLVFISVSDPVGSGFVKDFARPGPFTVSDRFLGETSGVHATAIVVPARRRNPAGAATLVHSELRPHPSDPVRAKRCR